MNSSFASRLAPHFHCVQGPPKAYFEIPLPPEFVSRLGGPTAIIIRYVTLGVVANEPPSEFIITQLEDYLWGLCFEQPIHDFYTARPNRLPIDNILFWRRQPEVRSGVAFTRPWTNLTMRLAIPGVNLESSRIPEGGQLPVIKLNKEQVA